MTTTFGDLIENVFRRVSGPVQEQIVSVNKTGGVLVGDLTVTFAGPQSAAVLPGVKISIDIEDMLVTGVTGQVATVVRGFAGSTESTHVDASLIYINSTVTRFDIAQAINDDLNDLSGLGLFRVGVATLSWNPVFYGYDLGALPTNYVNILGVEFRTIDPSRRFPSITEFDIRRWNSTTTDSAFPSGNALILYERGDPGQPIYVTYSAPFLPLVALTDSITSTPVANDPAPPPNGYGTLTTVPNLALTMTDIPPLGATIAIIQPHEISRNDMGANPDPRLAPEVPPGAVANSVAGLAQRRMSRINTEADRLYVQYPNRK